MRGRLLNVTAQVRGVRVHGLAASPDIERANASAVWLFVNGRAIRDRQLTHAVLRAYGEVMPHGRYPAAILFLEVPPRDVDVNVHPAKAEVRLSDARAAYEAIIAALRPPLAGGQWVQAPRSAELGAEQIADADALTGSQQALHASENSAEYGPSVGSPNGGGWESQQSSDRPAQPSLLAAQPYFSGLRYLGQLHRTYLVCEGPRGLVLIDQHAAHERMNYQRLRRAAERRGHVQPLLVPIVLRLAPAAAARVAESSTELAAIGVEIEPFGAGSIAIKALPGPLASLHENALASLLAELSQELEGFGRGESLDHRRDALLARAACHASVRANDSLAEDEAQALIAALDATDFGARCAHGRPVVAEWPAGEIEKRFGRDYASHAHAAAPESL